MASLAVGCVAGLRPSLVGGPLTRDESELWVMAEPLPEGVRLDMTAASLLRGDGTAIPLELRASALGGGLAGERLVAWGRAPHGTFAAIALFTKKEPLRIEGPFALSGGEPLVVSLRMSREGVLTGAVERRLLPQLAAYVPLPDLHELAVLDRRAHRVAEVLPAGRAPFAAALDPLISRAWVSATGDDGVDVIDLQSGATLSRIRLTPGDAPRDVVLTADRRLLVTANSGSNTVSLLDPQTEVEVARVQVAEEPTFLLLDRRSPRVYVFPARANAISVVDLGTRSVVATLATEDRPLRGQLDRDGTRLYVPQPASANVLVFTVPGFTLEKRLYAGLGVSCVQVDVQTNLVYVAHAGDSRLTVYEPIAFNPLDFVDLPGAPAWMAIDDAQNVLFAAVPEERTVAVVDLAQRRAIAAIDVAAEPRTLALTPERK